MTRAIVILGMLFPITGIPAMSEEPPTIPEIVRASKARESAIRNFRVHADFKEKGTSKYTGKDLDSATSMDVVIDLDSERFWYHKLAQIYNAPGGDLHGGQEFFSEIEEVMAFDGEKTRQLTLPHGEKDPDAVEALRMGKIYPGKKEYWLTDPREFVRNFLGEPLSVQVGRGIRTHLGVDSEGLVGIEVATPNEQTVNRPDGFRFRARFWFDPRNGMIALRREASVQRPGESGWIPYLVSRLDNLLEVGAGVWLPGRYSEEFHQVLPGKAPQLRWRREVVLSNWAINESLKDDQFAIAFPKGTLVGDEGLGRAYRARAVDDRTIAGMARTASNLRDAFQSMKNDPLPPYGPLVPTWAAMLAFSIATAGVIAMVFWVRRRSSPHPKGGT